MNKIGYGTWGIENGNPTTQAVLTAMETGYRHVDTAASYGNDFAVGKAIKKCGIPREELFITNKLWMSARGFEDAIAFCKRTLKLMKLEYLDEYLIHWPASKSRDENWEEINAETWRAMEELHREGLVRIIGTSNFYEEHLQSLLKDCSIKPMVNQIEFHPGYYQNNLLTYCLQNGMIIEAWSPLGSGEVLGNECLKQIAEKYEKSVAAVCLNWCISHGVKPIVRSINEKRMKDNLTAWNFELSKEDIERIDALEGIGVFGVHPDDEDLIEKLQKY